MTVAKTANKDYNLPFPTRLRFLLEEKGKGSQSQLADYIGVTRQAISAYSLGNSVPDIYKFQKMAEFFDVPLEFMLGESNNRERENIDIGETTGLDDAALNNIKMITSILFDKKEESDIDKQKISLSYNKAPQDILNIFLSSDRLLHLIFALYDAVNAFDDTLEMQNLFDVKTIKDLPDDISARFEYGVWTCNRYASRMIDETIEKYYQETKDGIPTITISATKHEEQEGSQNGDDHEKE